MKGVNAIKLRGYISSGNGEFTPEQRRQSLPIPTKDLNLMVLRGAGYVTSLLIYMYYFEV